MEDNKFMRLSLGQDHILSNIINNLSLDGIHDFSRTCKYINNRLYELKYTRSMRIVVKNFTFDNDGGQIDYFIRKMKNSPGDTFELRVVSDSILLGGAPANPSDNDLFSPENVKKFVNRVAQLFQGSDGVTSAKVILTRNFEDKGIFFEALKNVKNDGVTKIQFNIIFYEYTIKLRNIGFDIFSGFKNLKVIEILLSSEDNLNMYRYLLNCIPNNDKYTLNFVITNSTQFDKKDIHLKLVKLAGTRKLKLGIIDNGYSDARKLLEWIGSLSRGCFRRIVRLNVRAEMYQILNDYLLNVPQMENIETLSCTLFGDRGSAPDVAFIKRYLQVGTGGLTNLHHLKKLKQAIWYHPYPNRSEIDFTQYLNNSSFGFYAFIQILPITVEKLHVNGVKVIDSVFTTQINYHLPNLVYLHLSQIQHMGRMCLHEFKNLKYLVVHDCRIFEIPESIKALGVFRCKNEGCINLYHEWKSFINKQNRFKKTHEYLEHSSGSVFFNDIKDACAITAVVNFP